VAAAVTTPSVVKLPNAWFVACPSSQLREKPVAISLQGIPLVLFRAEGGVPAALLDRCPHRNVPLSMGKVVGGQLECGYHGWCFDGAGACRKVPGLIDAGDVGLKSRAAESYPAKEQEGYVWVYSTPGAMPESAPYRFPHLNDAGYSTVRHAFQVDATVHAVVENALDVPHTAFLHGGLFRTAEKKNDIEVVVRRFADHAEAEYLGEPRPSGIAGKLLAPGGGVVQHFDRFLLPSIAQVEYRLSEKSHLMTTSLMTPVSDFVTKVFAVVTFKLPLPAWLVKPFLTPIGLKIFAQDAVVLKAQTEAISRFGGERFTSTELDVLGHEVWRLLKQASTGEAPLPPSEHRVKMRT